MTPFIASDTASKQKSEQRLKIRKAGLAKLLAAENIKIVHRVTQTASFALETRTLTLPVYSSTLTEGEYDLFVMHEVGHALWTKATDWRAAIEARSKREQGIFKQFLNVVEDIRIEKNIKSRYPGGRRSFHAGYKNLVEVRDFFGTAGKDLSTYTLVDRINIHFKTGVVLNVPFTDEEISQWIEPLSAMRTWEDVVRLTNALFDAEKDKMNPPKEEKPSSGDEPDENDSAGDPGDDDSSGAADSGDDSPDGDDAASGDDGESDDGESDGSDDAADGDTEGDDVESDGTDDGESDKGGDAGDGESDGSDDGADGADGDDGVSDGADGADGDDDSADGESDGAGDESDGDDTADGVDGESNGSDADTDGADGESEKSTDDTMSSGNNDHRSEDSGGGMELPSAPETEKASEESLKKLTVDQVAHEPRSLKLPDFNTKTFVIDYKHVLEDFNPVIKDLEADGYYTNEKFKFQKSMRHARQMTSVMAAEFNRRKAARVNERSLIRRSGDLDMRRLANYKISDDIFLRNITKPAGKNHGLVLFVDFSGSMHSVLPSVIDQIINLTMFAQKVGIPFEVYAFVDAFFYVKRLHEINNPGVPFNDVYNPSNSYRGTVTSASDKEMLRGIKSPNAGKPGYLNVPDPDMTMVNFLSSRMSRQEYDRMVKGLEIYRHGGEIYTNNGKGFVRAPYGLTGTPLNTAVMGSYTLLREFKAKNNADIVTSVWITDGDATDRSLNFTDEHGKDVDMTTHDSIILPDRTEIGYRPPNENKSYSGYIDNSEKTMLLFKAVRLATEMTHIELFLANSKMFSKPRKSRWRSAVERIDGIVQRYSDNPSDEFPVPEDHKSYEPNPSRDIAEAAWKKDGFYALKYPMGFDEYIVINKESIGIADADFSDVDADDMSPKKVARAFKKTMGGARNSRKFLLLIASKIAMDVV